MSIVVGTLLLTACALTKTLAKQPFSEEIATRELQCVATEDLEIERNFFGFKFIQIVPAGAVVASGSGTLIGNGYLLTAGHVVWGCATFKGALTDLDTGTKFEVVKIDNEIDLALLQSSLGKDMASISFPDVDPVIGDSIRVWGFPMGNNIRIVTQGLISGVFDADYGDGLLKRQWLTDAQGISGCSGGGVYNDHHQFIGVFVGGTDWGRGDRFYPLGLIVPYDVVKQFLEDAI